MIAEREHHIVEFFEGDESASMSDFVVIDGIGEFCDFGAESAVAVFELTAFDTGWVLIAGVVSTFDEADSWISDGRDVCHGPALG